MIDWQRLYTELILDNVFSIFGYVGVVNWLFLFDSCLFLIDVLVVPVLNILPLQLPPGLFPASYYTLDFGNS